MRRMLPALLILVLVLTVSCVEQNQNNQVYKVEETANEAISLFGNETDAAYATLKAADNGYSTRQIVEAIHDKSLTDSGNIEGVSPSQTKQGAISSDIKADNIQVVAVSLSGLLLAAENASTKLKDPTYNLLDELTSVSSQVWMIWLLRATGEGYSAGQIETMLRQISKVDSRQSKLPPTVYYEGKDLAIVLDYNKRTVVKPKYSDTDWPFEEKDTVKDFLSDLAKDSEKFLDSLNIGRKSPATNGQFKGQTFDIELKLDPRYKGDKAISSYRMTVHVPEEGKVSGAFTIKIKEPEAMRTITGKFFDSHGTSVIFPVTFEIYGINADYKQTMRWTDGRTATRSDREDGALKGTIHNKYNGSGTFYISGLYFTWVI